MRAIHEGHNAITLGGFSQLPPSPSDFQLMLRILNISHESSVKKTIFINSLIWLCCHVTLLLRKAQEINSLRASWGTRSRESGLLKKTEDETKTKASC